MSDRNRSRSRPDVPVCALCAHIDEYGWHGVEGAAHCDDCHWTWRGKSICHCPACCQTFGSISASDLHDGPVGCLNPVEIPALMWSERKQAWVRRPSPAFQKLTRARTQDRQAPDPITMAVGTPKPVENVIVVVPA